MNRMSVLLASCVSDLVLAIWLCWKLRQALSRSSNLHIDPQKTYSNMNGKQAAQTELRYQ